MTCHEIRAVLNSRALLVKIKRDLENQIRGFLKNLGLVIGKARGTVFRQRAEELLGGKVSCGSPFALYWRSATRSDEKSSLFIASSWNWRGTTRTADVP